MNEDDGEFYKLWYSKKNRHIMDIWVQDSNGRRKVPMKGGGEQERKIIISKIEKSLGATHEEICEYFNKAYELENNFTLDRSKDGEFDESAPHD